MKVLVALLRESVLTQGLITSAFVLTTCYLWATGQEVPMQLWTADTIVIGFFFGSKTQQAARTIQKLEGEKSEIQDREA